MRNFWDEVTGRLFFPAEIIFVVALSGLIVWGIRWVIWSRQGAGGK